MSDINELKIIKPQLDELTKTKKEIEDRIKFAMQDAETLADANGNELATETVMNDTGVFMDWTTFTKSFQLVSGTRKMKYVVRGQDSKGWDGYYGPRFRNLSMKVK